MNVIGARPDGWWHDRRTAMRRLVEQLRRHADETGDAVTIVFDGTPFDVGDAAGRALTVMFAMRPGRHAADDRIVELVAQDHDATDLLVATSDRDLAARVRARGGEVVGARAFRRRVEANV
jgi:predicted RNA-binding protein with PIN domain